MPKIETLDKELKEQLELLDVISTFWILMRPDKCSLLAFPSSSTRNLNSDRFSAKMYSNPHHCVKLFMFFIMDIHITCVQGHVFITFHFHLV